MLNLRLETAKGEAYLASEAIVWISAAFKKGNFPESRSVGLSSGHTIFMINTPENIARLRESGVGDMIPPPDAKDKPRRRAGGRAKPILDGQVSPRIASGDGEADKGGARPHAEARPPRRKGQGEESQRGEAERDRKKGG